MRRVPFLVITFVFVLSALFQINTLVNPNFDLIFTQTNSENFLASSIDNPVLPDFESTNYNLAPSKDTGKQIIDNDTEVGGASDNVLRATFSTTYSKSSPNRKNNIKLATSKLNLILYPDEVFSFNRVVGERSKARGFLDAHIILEGKFVAGVGGGVCQVSSTLYNCALLADLEILCAHRHSLPVGYVSPSFDAMVSSRSDLMFVNSTASPIRIKAEADGNKITISIYGDMMTRKIVSRSVVLKTLPFEVEEIEDSNIPLGQTQTLSRGKNGIKSNGFIDIYEESKFIATRLIRRDSYQSQKRILAIGTKPPEVAPPHSQDEENRIE